MEPILTFVIFILLTASLNSLECGISNEQGGRILGGYPTSTSKYPWMVLLCRKGTFKCGGALIDEEWVLTAAHCVAKKNTTAKDYTFFLGIKSRSCSEKRGKAYKTAKIYVHPNYIKTNHNNDIALVKLASPVSNLGSKNSSNIICLPNSSTIDSYLNKKDCNYTGWGVGNYTPNYGEQYPFQLQVGVAVLKECYSSPYYKRTERRKKGSPAILKICSENPKTSACFGDSGGPLMCYNNHQWQLVGVLSTVKTFTVNCKKNCTDICKYGGYNKFIFVPQYMKWINDIMKKK